MLGHAEAVIDRSIAPRSIESGGLPQFFSRNAGHGLEDFGTVPVLRHELRPVLVFVPIAAFADELLVGQPFGDDRVGHGGQHRDIGSWLEREVVGGLDVGRADQVDTARVDHDQARALPQPPLEPACENRVSIGRVGADHHNHVGVHHAIEVLRARTSAIGL